MVWQIIWSVKSIKQLDKLDTKNSQRIIRSVIECTNDPFGFVTRLTNSPFYRLRIGDYRVVMDLQQNKLVIFVVELDHRSTIYK
jgi:mRNA interferase RelE/StbE